MPLTDYTESVGGGLKLKGVKDGGVKKKNKKKKAREKPTAEDEIVAGDEQKETARGEKVDNKEDDELIEQKRIPAENKYGKTEAQLRHEERKRQMLEERLKREGSKTHKEKVEELNKYLSRLSEHHDMPRIGPG